MGVANPNQISNGRLSKRGKMNWINVENQLPEDRALCVVCHESCFLFAIATYEKEENKFLKYDPGNIYLLPLPVSFWFPIPDHPVCKEKFNNVDHYLRVKDGAKEKLPREGA